MSEETKNDSIDEVEEMTSEDVDAQMEEEAGSEAAASELSEVSEEIEDDEEDSSAEADDDDDDDAEEESSDDDDAEAADEDDDEDESDDDDDADAEAADDDEDDSSDDDADAEAADDADDEAGDDAEEAADDDDDVDAEASTPVEADDDDEVVTGDHVAGIAAFFDHPDHLMYAAAQTRDSEYEAFDALSPFPIHGMDDALGVGRSWIPWVTFGAGCAGFSTAVGLQFGIMGFDWPMNFGGKPFIAWPSFVPIMFELTVLFAGVITGLVMLKAAGCFQKAFVIDTEITNDQFVLWISADDEHFDRDGVVEFMKELHPSEIRTIKKEA